MFGCATLLMSKMTQINILFGHKVSIEKVHLDDLDLYVITFIALATSVLL